MNIKEFPIGALVTRNAPCDYGSFGKADGSWLGERMTFLGIDEDAKIFYVKFTEGIFAGETHKFSFARDRWDEGWCAFPETLHMKVSSTAMKLHKYGIISLFKGIFINSNHS